MTKKLNAPIRYFGGKGGMFNNIIQHFPKNKDYDIYIEPFGGSYSIGIKATDYYLPPIEIYNDLEKNVYSLFKVFNDEEMFEKFKEKCDLCYYSEDIRRECKEQLKDETLSTLDRAFAFFYVNRSSHNGIGGISINTCIRRNMGKHVSDMLSTIDGMYDLHQRLSRLTVLNRDGIELIKQYDRDNTFMYCDPPYVQETRGDTRYAVDMDNDAQKRFVDTVVNCKKCRLLISGYDNELYKPFEENGFKKIKFSVNTVDGVRKPKEKTEVLWKNYDFSAGDD